MANLSNINGKFLFTDGDFLLIGGATANSISATESGVAIKNSNAATLSLQNSATNGKNHTLCSNTDGSFNITDVGVATRFTIASGGDIYFPESLRVGIGVSSIYPQGDNTVLKIYSASIPRFYLQNATTGSNVTDGSQLYVSSSDLNITNNESANIIFSTDALPRLTIDSSGNMTLLNATATNSRSIGITNSAGTTGWTLGNGIIANTHQFVIYDNTAGSARMLIDSSGNVGIGTTSPDYTLHLLKSSGDTEMYINGQNGQSSLRMGLDARNWQIKTAAAPYLWSLNYVGTDFQTPNIITATVGGNVGIGTASPDAKLEVQGVISSADSGLQKSTFANVGNDLVLTANADATNVTANILFKSSGSGGAAVSEKMRIDGSGNTSIYGRLGVGDAGAGAASLQLYIRGDSNSGDVMMQIDNTKYGSTDSSGESKIVFGWNNHSAANISAYKETVNTTGFKFVTEFGYNVTAERMRITGGGDVKIAMQNPTSNPSATNYGVQLVTGAIGKSYWQSAVNAATLHYHYEFINTNGQVGYIATSGSATQYVTSSDYRLKENVVEMTGALDRVSQLKPSRFNFISDADKTVDGFLAHEVQEIVPEAITGEKDAVDEEDNPVYQGIDQSKLVPLLVGAIKEQQTIIENLKERIQTLENN